MLYILYSLTFFTHTFYRLCKFEYCQCKKYLISLSQCLPCIAIIESAIVNSLHPAFLCLFFLALLIVDMFYHPPKERLKWKEPNQLHSSPLECDGLEILQNVTFTLETSRKDMLSVKRDIFRGLPNYFPNKLHNRRLPRFQARCG